MKCCSCQKEIEGMGVLLNGDGDFVCNEKCKQSFYNEMDKVCNMSELDFQSWLNTG